MIHVTQHRAHGMFFDHIEKLKREYTDKYVVVDDQLPELQRFAGWTGVVKTVNMSGRALVEFGKLENIGWYDIDVDFLKIVDEPLPEEETMKAEPAPAPKQPAAAKPDAGKMSVADVLAAARGGAASPAAKEPAKPADEQPKMSVEDIMAAARAEKSAPTAAAAAAPVASAEPEPAPEAAAAPIGDLPTTTADIVAWCRAHDGA